MVKEITSEDRIAAAAKLICNYDTGTSVLGNSYAASILRLSALLINVVVRNYGTERATKAISSTIKVADNLTLSVKLNQAYSDDNYYIVKAEIGGASVTMFSFLIFNVMSRDNGERYILQVNDAFVCPKKLTLEDSAAFKCYRVDNNSIAYDAKNSYTVFVNEADMSVKKVVLKENKVTSHEVKTPVLTVDTNDLITKGRLVTVKINMQIWIENYVFNHMFNVEVFATRLFNTDINKPEFSYDGIEMLIIDKKQIAEDRILIRCESMDCKEHYVFLFSQDDDKIILSTCTTLTRIAYIELERKKGIEDAIRRIKQGEEYVDIGSAYPTIKAKSDENISASAVLRISYGDDTCTLTETTDFKAGNILIRFVDTFEVPLDAVDTSEKDDQQVIPSSNTELKNMDLIREEIKI